MRATFDDLAKTPEHLRFHEVVRGEVVEKARRSGEHGATQVALCGTLFGPFSRRRGGRVPGGWWLGTNIAIELERHEVYEPDMAGWRRERSPELPDDYPLRVRPDWVCEILSPSNARNDEVAKLETYRRCGVPYYWIVDPAQRTLRAHRWTPDGYLVALTAEGGQRVRAEPFDAIELEVGVLFGDDPVDSPE